MLYKIIEGDITEVNTEVIVNSWNVNIIPWFLLLPQGVSKSIKKKCGYKIFNDLMFKGRIPLGNAVLTSAGKMENKFKGIIHVAGINLLYFATEYSISNSVKNSIKLAVENGFKSITIPLIGSGSGNRKKDFSLKVIEKTIKELEELDIEIFIIKFKK